MKQPETHFDFNEGTGAQPVVVLPTKLTRIGVYSSSFDPVHAGHIVFALKAQKAAGLDYVYFVPERRPGHGGEPEHHVHRSVMLNSALSPYPQFKEVDIPDARLSLRSLNRVQRLVPQAEYSLLTSASDILWYQGDLPAMYSRLNLIIAVTSPAQTSEVLARLSAHDRTLGNITFINIGTDHITSASVRHALRTGKRVKGLLPSVWRYARKQWLYLPPIHR